MKRKGLIVFCCTLIMILFWGTVSYADENLNQVRELIQRNYVGDVVPDVLNKTSVQEMVYSLNDPYSVYIEPDEFQEFLSSLDGKYAGVGMYIQQVDQICRVLSPMPGSPAEKAGIKSGDIITHVNGQSMAGRSSSEVAATIRGPEGTSVTVTVKRGQKVLNFKLIRETIHMPSVDYRLIEPKVGYLKLYSFNSESPEEIDDALDDMMSMGIETLVLDLCDNPGGLLSVAVDIAGNFVPKGPVVFVNQKGNREYTLRSFDVPRGLPTAVLVNEDTASAAEILAGAIQDAKTGFLVGTKTFGKGSVQTIFTLPNGGGLKLTTAKYLTRGRQEINSKGLTPDIFEKDAEKQLETAAKKLYSQVKPYDIQLRAGSRVVFVGFNSKEMSVAPNIENGTFMVPLRNVAEYLGYSVKWDQGKVLVNSSERKLIVDVNAKKMIGSGLTDGSNQPVQVKNGSTMVPVRSLAEAFDCRLFWHQKTNCLSLMQ